MKTLKLQNATLSVLRLCIEPYPDQYDVDPGSEVELRGFSPAQTLVEVIIQQDPEGVSFTVDASQDIEVYCGDTRLSPL